MNKRKRKPSDGSIIIFIINVLCPLFSVLSTGRAVPLKLSNRSFHYTRTPIMFLGIPYLFISVNLLHHLPVTLNKNRTLALSRIFQAQMLPTCSSSYIILTQFGRLRLHILLNQDLVWKRTSDRRRTADFLSMDRRRAGLFHSYLLLTILLTWDGLLIQSRCPSWRHTKKSSVQGIPTGLK